jgi:hypothetical protein
MKDQPPKDLETPVATEKALKVHAKNSGQELDFSCSVRGMDCGDIAGNRRNRFAEPRPTFYFPTNLEDTCSTIDTHD